MGNEEGAEIIALGSLKAYPRLDTPELIANGIFGVDQLGAADIKAALIRLKARGEVLFWRVGATEPSGKFTDCQVQDGRNWNCRPTAETSGTVAHEIVHGRPIADTSGLAQPLHAVPKWKWWLLRRGISIGNDANG